jgi:hypothetical protein
MFDGSIISGDILEHPYTFHCYTNKVGSDFGNYGSLLLSGNDGMMPWMRL